MATKQEVIELCRLIFAQTGKRPTVRAVLAGGTIRGDRSKIAKIVSQFNQSQEQQPSRVAVAPEIRDAWENALKGLTETVFKPMEAQGTKIAEDKSDALLVAFDAADKVFAYAEQMEGKEEELESKLTRLHEELVAVRTSTSVQQEDAERRLMEFVEKTKAASEKASQEIEAYKTQIFELKTELQGTIQDREAKIKTLETENTELRIRATAGEAALQSKAEELNRFIQERERIDVLHCVRSSEMEPP